jgi:uncharacterized metal-binding protein
MINLVICGGYSPGARVLRAAVRGVAKCNEVQVVTLCPALAGLENRVEEIMSMDPERTVVVDGCEAGCAVQGLQIFGFKARSSLILDKYPVVSEKYVKEAEDKVRRLLTEVKGT